MYRLMALCLLALSGLVTAQACDMRVEARSANLPGYYDTATTCLDTPPTGLRFDAETEALFLDQINRERRSAGLNPLKLRPALRPAARFHSLDMATNAFFEHKSPDGRKAGERIAALDRQLLSKSTAENIAQFGPVYCTDQNQNRVSCAGVPGFRLPGPDQVATDLHEQLMDSEWHRANILNRESTHMAIGVVRTESGYYVTQVFAEKMGELSAPLPVRINFNGRLPAIAHLQDWDFGSFGITGANADRVDLTGQRMHGVSLGDKSLIVRGERISREVQGNRTLTTTQWLDLFGPSFTVVSARGS